VWSATGLTDSKGSLRQKNWDDSEVKGLFTKGDGEGGGGSPLRDGEAGKKAHSKSRRIEKKLGGNTEQSIKGEETCREKHRGVKTSPE